jgi:hypothetical protein
VWQKLFKPTWKGLNPTFEHLKDSLERHLLFIRAHGSSLRNCQPGLDQGDELALVESGVDIIQDRDDARMEFCRYRKNMDGSRDQFEEKEKARKEEEKRSVMTWISASKNTQSLHKKFRDARKCPDTGRWLFRRYREVTDWMKEDQPPDSALWLHGSKGFGSDTHTTKKVELS